VHVHLIKPTLKPTRSKRLKLKCNLQLSTSDVKFNLRRYVKEWWCDRVVWPYPTEEDKKSLGAATGLNPTQINNWFINQRKRHWHKLFYGGAAPASAEEAAEVGRCRLTL